MRNTITSTQLKLKTLSEVNKMEKIVQENFEVDVKCLISCLRDFFDKPNDKIRGADMTKLYDDLYWGWTVFGQYDFPNEGYKNYKVGREIAEDCRKLRDEIELHFWNIKDKLNIQLIKDSIEKEIRHIDLNGKEIPKLDG